MKKLTVMFATALLTLALVVPASAASAPVVWDWHWEYNAAFTEWADTGDPVDGSNITAEDPVTLDWDIPSDDSEPGWQTLKWGFGNFGPSYININPIAYGDSGYGVIETGEAASTVAHLTHYNYPLNFRSETLTWGLVGSTFKLTPNAPPADQPDPAYYSEFEFMFYETPNDSAYPNDVFLLLPGSSTSESFMYEGREYIFNFGSTFEVIPEDYINALKANPDFSVPDLPVYLGWTTLENANNVFDTFVTVTAVPEPSTFILLGAGLLGLVGIARRRRS